MLDKLILGTVQLGIPYGINNKLGQPSAERAFEILSSAHDNGIKFLDTAAAYGDSERIIGDYHKRTDKRFSVITKFHVKSGVAIQDQVDEALQRLDKKDLDVLQLHSYQDLIEYPQVLGILSDLKDKGLIGKIGVSLYTNSEIEATLSSKEIDVIQVPFNLLDNDYQRGSLLKEAKKQGKIVHVRSIFLQGLFFKDTEELPINLLPLKPYLIRLRELIDQYGISMADLALSYAMSKEYIDGVLIGIDSVKQLEENIASLSTPVPVALTNLIDNVKVDSVDLLNPSNWQR